MTVERIDNDGDYGPGNVRWATQKEQQRNKTTNRFLTLDGVTMALCDWAEKIGICQSSLRERLDKWPLRAALTKPPQR